MATLYGFATELATGVLPVAFGAATAWAPLQGALRDAERRQRQLTEIRQRIVAHRDGPPLVFITHGIEEAVREAQVLGDRNRHVPCHSIQEVEGRHGNHLEDHNHLLVGRSHL